MKKAWLNLVLLLTNRVYSRKQAIPGQVGLAALTNVFVLILSEMFLGLISLPLYLTLKPEKVTAYFSEKGSYDKVNTDYGLRRILTITGVGLVAFLWVIKLVIILTFPLLHGPLQLYSVSNLQPIDILSKNLITTETGIQTARVVNSIARPELDEVRKVRGGNYTFLGKGQPNSTIVLLLSDVSTAVYTTNVNRDGLWQIDHEQKSFRLSEGNHSIIIFNYNSKLGVRSETAPEQFFKVTSSWLDLTVKNIDSLANWSIVLVVFIGIFLIFLTL